MGQSGVQLGVSCLRGQDRILSETADVVFQRDKITD